MVAQLSCAIDEGMDHRAAGVGLESDGGCPPLFTEAPHHLAEVAVGRAGKSKKETVITFEHRSRPHKALLPQPSGSVTGLRGPSGVDALVPSPVGQVLNDAAGHAAGDTQSVNQLFF